MRPHGTPSPRNKRSHIAVGTRLRPVTPTTRRHHHRSDGEEYCRRVLSTSIIDNSLIDEIIRRVMPSRESRLWRGHCVGAVGKRRVNDMLEKPTPAYATILLNRRHEIGVWRSER